ncbi:MAG: DUF169 domain-containing protein [Bacteroidales bacterium]
MINQMKSIFGNKCTGIKLNTGEYKFLNKPAMQMKFCEAVNYSFTVPIELKRGKIECPGARRSLGIDREDNQLTKIISENTQIPVSYIKNGLANIPVLKNPISNITFGITEEMEDELRPDVFIAYTSPEQIMKFMHQAACLKIQPKIPPYSLHSICGNVFSRVYEDNVISISFGCPESRKYGGVDANEAIIGIPYDLFNLFLNQKPINAN